jgi:F-type H+-transporting ATPase subunit epsilon
MAGRRAFEVSLVTPEGPVYEGEAEMLVVPGAAGQIGVLARHVPLVAMLEAGETRVHVDGGQVYEFETGAGFFNTDGERALVLVDDAVPANEVDAEHARRQLEEAEAALERVVSGEEEGDMWQLEQRIQHARNQLRAAGRG